MLYTADITEAVYWWTLAGYKALTCKNDAHASEDEGLGVEDATATCHTIIFMLPFR